MTLQEIINILKKIALTQPNVRTATSGDIYEVMNGNPSVKYGVFHITQNTHQSFDDRDVYGLNLFYVDRNEDDNANTLQVQSVGKTVIDNIVKSFCEEFDGEFPTITYTPFTQRFKDDTAGVFAGLSLEVYKEWTCAEGFGDFITPQVIVRNQDKTIKVTQSGIYVVTPDEGYTGLGEVVVDAELANTVQDVKSIEITENGEYSVVADAPFLSIGKVDIDVNLPLQEDKSVMIADNGTYTVTKDDGYVGMVDVDIVVDLPIQNKKELTVNNNGTYTISADDEYVGMKTAEVTFEYQPKKQLPNGMRLTGSTFTEFDMTLYDWSRVYDYESMFQMCGQLTTLNAIENAKPLNMKRTFASCNSLTTINGIENWNTSNVTNMEELFAYCYGFTSLDLSSWDVSNVTNMKSLFAYCGGLTSLDLSSWDVSNVTNMSYMFSYSGLKTIDLSSWDVSNVTDMSYMFNHCSFLTSVKMGGSLDSLSFADRMFYSITTTGTLYYPAQYDYSKVIAALPKNWSAVAY